MSKKIRKALLMIACFALAIGLSIGGTIAWLTSTPVEVKNTFTVGDVEITLDEGDVYELDDDGQDDENLGQFIEGADRVYENEYQIIPDNTYRKDPTVTVTAGSEDCWLFVEFTESPNAKDYFEYYSTLTTANGWTQGTGTTGEGVNGVPTNVWYREVAKVAATAKDPSWQLLETKEETDGTEWELKVKNDVENGDMTAASAITLTWKAYAIQTANIDTAADAWTKVNAAATNGSTEG